ncbi:LacI family DNA-binding transcriptional regulator [Leucobacter albus]|uniref:LacI family DNA-binding transcriptional regulator n=1 Tax=Leucobacter albus TaxID=272210 RepID=A0ABW3TI27_9MICO
MGTTGTVTLKDLAAALELSPSTVSRVLNDPDEGSSRWASAETVARIHRLANELNYSRNPHAASLRTSRSNMVGVIAPSLQDYVFASIYEGIARQASTRGYYSIVSSSHDDEQRRRALTDQILDRHVAGLIFGDAHLDSPGFFADFAKRGVPYLLVSRRLPGELSVTCDDYAGGRIAAEHLLGTGRTSFGVLAGQAGASTAQDRVAGFIDALTEAGIPDSRITAIYTNFDAVSGREAMAGILDIAGVPEAVFATNDFAAIGATGLLRERGLRVPEDVLMCGFNDTPLAEGVNLTSVRSPMEQMGERSMAMLADLADGKQLESEALMPEIVARASTRR